MEGLAEFTRTLGDLTKEKPRDGKTTKRLQTEANEFLVKGSSQKGGAVLEGLMKTIIEGFEEEVERDARRRANCPNTRWGPSYRQQLVNARKNPRFQKELENIRKEYPMLSLKQMRAFTFVRYDRILKEKLEEEALREGQRLLDGFYVASPAAALNVDIERHKIMYREAARRNAMIQTNGHVKHLMKEAEGA